MNLRLDVELEPENQLFQNLQLEVYNVILNYKINLKLAVEFELAAKLQVHQLEVRRHLRLEVEVAVGAVAVGGEVRDAGKLDHGGGAAHEGDCVVGCLGELVLAHLRRDEALREHVSASKKVSKNRKEGPRKREI